MGLAIGAQQRSVLEAPRTPFLPDAERLEDVQHVEPTVAQQGDSFGIADHLAEQAVPAQP